MKNRFNSMLKKIREEKTFKAQAKSGIQEALAVMQKSVKEEA